MLVRILIQEMTRLRLFKRTWPTTTVTVTICPLTANDLKECRDLLSWLKRGASFAWSSKLSTRRMLSWIHCSMEVTSMLKVVCKADPDRTQAQSCTSEHRPSNLKKRRRAAGTKAAYLSLPNCHLTRNYRKRSSWRSLTILELASSERSFWMSHQRRSMRVLAKTLSMCWH